MGKTFAVAVQDDIGPSSGQHTLDFKSHARHDTAGQAMGDSEHAEAFQSRYNRTVEGQ